MGIQQCYLTRKAGGSLPYTNWRHLKLRAPKADGSWALVEMLRPVWWLEEQIEIKLPASATVTPTNPIESRLRGQTVHLSVPECGIEGEAEVLHVGPCPDVPHSDNVRIVTATFQHFNARVLDIHIAGEPTPIGTTANHPFWSEDRQAFIRADELHPGEHLRPISDGLTTVASIHERSGRHTVYNLETQVDHVYHVGRTALLVHNALPCKMELYRKLRRQGVDKDLAERITKGKIPDSNRPVGPQDVKELRGKVGDGFETLSIRSRPVGAEHHHLLPQGSDFKKHWDRLGLDIEDFRITLDPEEHRLLPNGIHANGVWERNWNQRWDDFFDSFDGAPELQDVFDQLRRMMDEFYFFSS